MKEQSLVRASDLGLWAFCHRAWWLARVQGIVHQRPERLARGTTFHEAHGTTLRRAQRYHRWGHICLAVSLVLSGLLLSYWLWVST